MPLPEIPVGLATEEPVARRIREAFTAMEFRPTSEVRLDLTGLPHIPATLVRWLLLTAMPVFDNIATRLTLWHATIEGRLNLAGVRLSTTPCFAGCTFVPGTDQTDVGIDLTDAIIVGFEAIGGSLGTIRADRLSAGGTLLVRGARPDPTYRHDLPPDVGATVSIPGGILLSGSKIRGNLDLRGAQIGPLPDGPANEVVAMLADGLSLEGNLLLCDGAQVEGEVRLNGSRILRNLDCSGAHLNNPRGFSLSAAGAEIKGTVYLCRSVNGNAMRSVGTLRLEGAHIQGDLDASGGVFTATAFHEVGWQRESLDASNDDVVALDATGLEVDAAVRLCDGFIARGAIDLILAKIGGDLHCSDASFHFPGEEALYADGATISGCAYFSRGRSTGLIRFVRAQLKQGCAFDDFTFDLGHQCRAWVVPGSPVERELGGSDLSGVYAAGAIVGGSLFWTGIRRMLQGADLIRAGGAPRRVIWLSAPGATVTQVSDDEVSWNVPDRIDLSDCLYQHIDRLTTDVTWRLTRLDREYAQWNTHAGWGATRLAWEVLSRTLRGEQRRGEGLGEQVRRFAPGPYLQLAHVLREAGLQKAAQTVLLQLERNSARYSGLAVRGVLWRWVIDLTLRYGLSPFRPVLFVLGWAVASGILFKWVHDTKLAAGQRAMHAVNVADHVTFNWFFYALDTLVPFVDLGQKKHFLIDPMWSLGGSLLLLKTFLGYAAASFLAAGLGGLVRTGRSGG